jgi:hypothetical protein
LSTQVESFVAVAEVSHGNMYTVISKHACGHRAKTGARAGDQGDAIVQIHDDASLCASPTHTTEGPLPPNNNSAPRIG